jgi:WhiB family transcriptional regulator, redox-sensing transcriptional regulator
MSNSTETSTATLDRAFVMAPVADPLTLRTPPTEQEQLMDTVISLVDPSEYAGPDPLEPDSRVARPAVRAPVPRCADGHGTLTALFFSDHVADIARAKAMCQLCPLKESCLAGALEREEPWGVWGGELLSGGRIIANKRPCGRPPKRPRPEVVYDEMGPVGVVA